MTIAAAENSNKLGEFMFANSNNVLSNDTSEDKYERTELPIALPATILSRFVITGPDGKRRETEGSILKYLSYVYS
jgi:hypothetical protein